MDMLEKGTLLSNPLARPYKKHAMCSKFHIDDLKTAGGV